MSALFYLLRNTKTARLAVMAQVFPLSAQIIYDTLVSDATFMSFVGEYRFRADKNTAVPAISIVTPGQDLPAVKSTTGVEVVIHDAASVRRRDYYDSSNLIADWKVYLICWEPSVGIDLTNAVFRMMQRFSGSNSMEVVATADGLGAQVQTLVMIPADKPILEA